MTGVSERLLLTHGCSLSNLPLFVAEGAGLFEREGLQVEVPVFTNTSSTSDALRLGLADLGTAAFIQPLLDYQQDDPPVVVAGSGLMGISLMAHSEIETVADLEGRPVGTFRGDPLEVLLHDALQAAGLTMSQVDVRYGDDLEDSVAAFENGELAAITVAEPYATRVSAVGHQLSDGTELWGNPFPDTVLVAAASMLTSRPELIKSAIRAMLRAETMIHSDLRSSVQSASRQFPGFTIDQLVQAARNQPPQVDVRNLHASFFARWASLQSLGLVPDGVDAPASILRLELLEAVLDEPVGNGG